MNRAALQKMADDMIDLANNCEAAEAYTAEAVYRSAATIIRAIEVLADSKEDEGPSNGCY